MEFKKYVSLINHYDLKSINYILNKHPELKETIFIIEEKIHGANFTVYLENDEISYASRNQIVTKFYGFQEVLEQEKFKLLFRNLTILFPNQEIAVIGELFGGSIQKGVNYGSEKDFKIFDIRIDGEYISPFEVLLYLDRCDSLNLHVPILGIAKGFKEAMAFDVNINSKILLCDGENIMEGGVIKVYHGGIYKGEDGSPFIVKKKNDIFLEKSKQPREKKILPDDVLALRLEFAEYLNMNRVESAISKFGEFSERDFGKLIPMILNDAIEEFIIDFPQLMELEKNDRKYVTHSGAVIARLLKEYLKNQ